MSHDTTRTATVLGATGLVGTELLAQLDNDPTYARVVSLGRRPLSRSYEKVEHRIMDFTRPDEYAAAIASDVLFSALGTTRKAAGSKEAQWRVDYDYQLWAARAAAHNGVDTCVLVSAVGAHPDASVFYSRMKGQLEAAILELPFARIRFLRPSFLDGERAEKRPLERAALSALRKFPAWSLPSAVRPVPVQTVARACLLAAEDLAPGVAIWEPRDILALGSGKVSD